MAHAQIWSMTSVVAAMKVTWEEHVVKVRQIATASTQKNFLQILNRVRTVFESL